MKFENLIATITQTHNHFQLQAVKAVNISLTIRNWLIGYYIVEFEQNGDDRAKYGDKLLIEISKSIAIKGLGLTNIKLSRLFYTAYPQIIQYIKTNVVEFPPIRQLTSDEFQVIENESLTIRQSASDEFNKSVYNLKYITNLVTKISFSHFAELIKIEDYSKRTFFELLILNTTPTVEELKHQINTLSYERVGLSSSTETAFDQLQNKILPALPIDAIKNIYTFDFLGLKNDSLIVEQDLEAELINHLQAFIQELGNGFCFEARQKRILIDDEYYFADLVFYHRLLKCHVIVELKADAFKHEYLSQLNTYVAYYNAEVKQTDDNPAVGILLCTQKGKKLVEYATAGMDNQLFVSKYLLTLPKKEEFEVFIQNELRAWK